jgi:hypothetical protein
LNYCVVFLYKGAPSGNRFRDIEPSVATVWTTFETRREAQEWAEQRVTPSYSYQIRGLCNKKDWMTVQEVFSNVERVSEET